MTSATIEKLPTFGRLGHLTQQQQQTLDTFKSDLTTAGILQLAAGSDSPSATAYDDHILLRFLRARKFDLAASTAMFTGFHNWRREFGVDALRDGLEFPELPIVKKFYPRYYHKTDKLGRPIYFEILGGLDVKQLFAVTNTDRLLKNHVYEYEKLVKYRLAACSEKTGLHIEQSCTILDLKNVSLSSFSSVYSVVQQVSKIAQEYYPEMLGKMFIINAPMLFTAVWSIVKAFLDEVTLAKIQILGSSYKSKLLEIIDEGNLPVEFGGKCQCAAGGGGGCAGSDLGPWNDGSVPGYPKKEYERLNIEFGFGQAHLFAEKK